MNERLPYEDHLQQQWTDIPLPEENAAWEDMRRRLEEEEEERGFFWWWRPGCAWLILLLILAGAGWWAMQESKKDHKEENSADNPIKKQGTAIERQEIKDTIYNVQPKISGNKPRRSISTADPYSSAVKPGIVPGSGPVPGSIPSSDSTPVVGPVTTPDSIPLSGPVPVTPKKPLKKSVPSKTIDSIARINPPDSNRKHSVFFSTGIAFQQQLPFAGQKATPYSSTGRKSSLADYIPSLYMRVNKKNKWFIQGEFRYGAPQYSKEFQYQQASVPDTGGSPRFTIHSAAKLKKTFYHQLPLSFHYHITPRFTVGGGVIWNKFYAAISDQETVKHINATQQDSIVFKGIVTIKNDTSGNFARSYLQGLLETQYRWKRFSFGARYAMGLQPYIRYTLPGIGAKEERNSSLQLFLRLELWRSGRQKDE